MISVSITYDFMGAEPSDQVYLNVFNIESNLSFFDDFELVSLPTLVPTEEYVTFIGAQVSTGTQHSYH